MVKGAKGGDVMTKTHAAGSALTYGQRYLLKMIFNIAIGSDDDGNAASSRQGVRVPSPSEVQDAAPKHQNPRGIVPEENDTFEKWTGRYLAGLEGATSVAELVEWDTLNDAPLATISNKSKPHYNRIMNRFEELKGKFQRDSISTGSVISPTPKADAIPSSRPDGCPDPAKEPDAFLKWADKRLAPILDAEQVEIVYCEIIDPASDGREFPPDREALQAILAKHQKRLGAD